MKFVVLALAACVAAAQATPVFVNEDIIKAFEIYKAKFGKKYSNGADETLRLAAFEQNARKVASHNALHDLGLKTFRLGLNQFADLTNQEYRRVFLGYKSSARRSALNTANTFNATMPVDALPKSVDWRQKGLVTPVKDQGQCGSCWAFSAVASLEGQHAKAAGKLVSLSEQNLVDCSGDEGNEGCDGGLMDNAFEYIEETGGIDTEKAYPYEAVDDTCRFKKSSVGATLTGYKDIKTGSESALQQAVATVGPISVAIDASSEEFQLYESGVYQPEDCSSTQLDHGVTAVGYDTAKSADGSTQDYWIVKNSWAETWGQKGYIYMVRNAGNVCGIASEASYPIVSQK